MPKPVLLLDVDGVLSVIDSTSPARRVRLFVAPGEFVGFHPIKNTLPLLELAWRLFDVHWMTAWREDANIIAKWAGLPERPVLLGDWGKGFDDWKAEAVSRFDAKGRRVAWIEDGIGPEAKAIVAERGWTYLHCHPFTGVTVEHLNQLEKFAGGKL